MQEKEKLAPAKAFLTSTTGWAAVFCLVGAAAIFMPWMETLTFHGPMKDGVIQAKSWPSQGWAYGTRLWHGYPTTFAFLGLLLFLFLTSPIKPIPLWRSIVLFLAAVGILTLIVIGREYNHRPSLGDAPQEGIWVGYSWAIGSYVPIASALALTFIAGVEIRARVKTYITDRKSGQKPDLKMTNE
jgi:hypothetical protein